MSTFLVILLPTLGFVSGILGLQSDPKSDKRKATLVFGVLLLTALGTIVASLAQQHSDSIQKQQDAENITFLKGMLNAVKLDTSGIKNLVAQMLTQNGVSPAVIQRIETQGLAPEDVKLAEQSQSAEAARSALLPAAIAANTQQKATVLYFPKDVDGPKVVAALQQGGFDVRQQVAGEKNPSLATNAVWVGDNVSLDQAKYVTLTLIRAGIQIRSLRRLRDSGSGPRSTLIEVGADAEVQNLPVLTAEDVQKMSSLPPRQ